MMNKQDILKKIGGIINELNEQHQYLSTTPKINILELELFTANADFLIDHIEILKKINNQAPDFSAQVVEAKTEVERPVFEPVVQPIEEEKVVVLFDKETEVAEPKAEEIEEEKKPLFNFNFEEPTEMVFDFEKQEVDVKDFFDRQLTEEEQNLIVNKERQLVEESTNSQISTKQESYQVAQEMLFVQETVSTTEILIDEIAKEDLAPVNNVEQVLEEEILPKADKVKSLNETFSAKIEYTSISENIKPIADLKSAINLNDKMLFIKELFNGYNLAYSEAIEILNRFDSFEAADNFLLKNYAEKNNWALKQNTVDRLYEILNRKFKR